MLTIFIAADGEILTFLKYLGLRTTGNGTEDGGAAGKCVDASVGKPSVPCVELPFEIGRLNWEPDRLHVYLFPLPDTYGQITHQSGYAAIPYLTSFHPVV